MALIWPQAILDQIRPWSEKCYPYEGCGILLGLFEGETKKVARFAALPNRLRERDKSVSGAALESAAAALGGRMERGGNFEFVMDPAEFNAAALAAEKDGLDVVGILHTHPDHPARPSAVDAAQPLLAGWSNVIVKVDQGRFVEARSWVRDEESRPFEEEPVSIA
jgi:proteasome lid subunit RPN8/RPN11